MFGQTLIVVWKYLLKFIGQVQTVFHQKYIPEKAHQNSWFSKLLVWVDASKVTGDNFNILRLMCAYISHAWIIARKKDTYSISVIKVRKSAIG